jgi:outer membrane protein
MQVLPNLNANASNYFNSGQRIDPFTNQFVAGDWTESRNYSLSANATLFNGFQTINTIKQSQYDAQAGAQDLLKIQNDISLNVASGYLQILFSQELLANAKNQVAITQQQVERTQKLVEAGSVAKGNLLDIQAQMASEELNLVTAENTFALATLNLKQLLNVDSSTIFSVVAAELALPAEALIGSTSEQIYQTAVTKQPEIKSSELKLMSAEKGIAIARGARYPRLTVGASYGTGYSGASKQLVGTPNFAYTPNGYITSTGTPVLAPVLKNDFATTPFETQLKNNLNRSVGLALSVPLFNNLQTHTAVVRAKINRENAWLGVQQQKNNLKKNIQQAYNDSHAALKKYQASKKAVNAIEESFRYMEQKYNLGAVSTLDYNDSKNKLTKAKSDWLQAKYDYVFKLKILDFYQGKPITL